jgi:hypothetical protein
MSRKELRHPHVMGQIMLLSRVTSHELSIVSVPLVGDDDDCFYYYKK